ncbi:MAG: hypothetical protein VKQ33_04705 [Candidatus Sericytochromatia bacterium]|nr:hypothetical protein [Candidatus Sericytochromatia bacterium]
MATCYYHPDTRAKFVCPDCGQDVCDACRLEGGLQRCAHCAVHGPPEGGPAPRPAEPRAGGAMPPPDYESIPVEPFPPGTGYEGVAPEGGGAYQAAEAYQSEVAGYGPEAGFAPVAGTEAPAAGFDAAPVTGFDDFLAGVAGAEATGAAEEPLVMCSYHGDVVADIQCLNCFQPYCMACLPAGTTCAACKADPGGRAVQAEEASPVVSDLGYEPGMDFAASYLDRGGIHEGLEAYEASSTAAVTARPRKAGGARKGGGKRGGGAKKAPPKAKGRALNPKLLLGGLGALAVVGVLAGGAWWFLAGKGGGPTPPPAYTGPAKVEIVAPKAQTIRGFKVLKLQVAAPTAVDHVEVLVGGKRFALLKRPPFKTDWPTNGRPNGKVEVVVKAYYKRGPTVQAKRTYIIKNR